MPSDAPEVAVRALACLLCPSGLPQGPRKHPPSHALCHLLLSSCICLLSTAKRGRPRSSSRACPAAPTGPICPSLPGEHKKKPFLLWAWASTATGLPRQVVASPSLCKPKGTGPGAPCFAECALRGGQTGDWRMPNSGMLRPHRCLGLGATAAGLSAGRRAGLGRRSLMGMLSWVLGG